MWLALGIFSFAESASLWCRIGGKNVRPSVRWAVCVRRFNLLPIRVSSWNFQDIFLVCPRWCTSFFLEIGSADFFWRPKKGVLGYFGTPPSVFELECSNFQNVSYLPWLKFCRKRNFDLGPPKKARGGPKMAKILNFFIIQGRTFKT